MKSFPSSLVRFSLVAAVVLCASACEPRGETLTLDRVLERAREKYQSALASVNAGAGKDGGAALPPEVAARLKSVTDELEGMVRQAGVDPSAEVARSAGQVSEALADLAQSAGYTSRPAMGELVSQLEALAGSAAAEGKSFDGSKARLVASRVYSLLSSELEGVKFSLGEREARK